MGSSVVVSLGFPATEDTGEGTRDVRGGGGSAREQTRQRRHAPAAGVASGKLCSRHLLSSRVHAEVRL